MKASSGVWLVAIASVFHAIVAGAHVESVQLGRRALPNSPNGYTPTTVKCSGEQRPSVRDASSLSPSETDWVERRRDNTLEPMQDLLRRLEIPGFDVDSYMNGNAGNISSLPNIAISYSGGGYRALQYGAGVMAAFDSRTDGSTSPGHLGGLLQSSTYVSGLSGGGWLTGSIFLNNFTSVTALRDDDAGTVWNFASSIAEGPVQEGNDVLNTAEYFQNIADSVDGKETAGFETTLTDYWGRGLAFQMIDASQGGPAYTWSSIALTDDFEKGNMPMPIVLAVERKPGEEVIARNSTVFEFNPFEMGTWDPTVFGFVPTKYLGSGFQSGSLPDDSCVVGFDNAGFIMGTSSSLFNAVVMSGNDKLPEQLQSVVSAVSSALGFENEDIADYPNPFFQYNSETNPSADTDTLTLVDGGLDFQNIPLHPVIQPNRKIDIIFAVDSSADTTFNWPNGTALVTTYERSQPDVAIANGTAFPAIPDVNTMVNLGLNNRPTFFGCDAANITTDYVVPLVVYMPHSPYVFNSNFSTFDPQAFNDSTRNAIIQNGYNVATMGNATVNADWPVCVGCAIISRSLGRTGAPVPDACAQCFRDYCWDGTLNPTEPPNYEPRLRLDELSIQQDVAWRTSGPGSSVLLALVTVTTIISLLALDPAAF